MSYLEEEDIMKEEELEVETPKKLKPRRRRRRRKPRPVVHPVVPAEAPMEELPKPPKPQIVKPRFSPSVYILASGAPRAKMWQAEGKWTKSVIELYEGYTFLDYQMEYLQKHFKDITIVVGYNKEQIYDLVAKRGWGVRYVEDKGWRGVYSSGRTIWELQDEFLNAPYPLFTLYNDILFNDKTVTDLMKCSADICCIRNTQDFVKWSKAGMKELINILNNRVECRENESGLSYPTWGHLRWNDSIKWATVDGGYYMNINNHEHYWDVVNNKFGSKVQNRTNLIKYGG